MRKGFSILLLFSRDSPFVHEGLVNFTSLFSPFFMVFCQDRARTYIRKQLLKAIAILVRG